MPSRDIGRGEHAHTLTNAPEHVQHQRHRPCVKTGRERVTVDDAHRVETNKCACILLPSRERLRDLLLNTRCSHSSQFTVHSSQFTVHSSQFTCRAVRSSETLLLVRAVFGSASLCPHCPTEVATCRLRVQRPLRLDVLLPAKSV